MDGSHHAVEMGSLVGHPETKEPGVQFLGVRIELAAIEVEQVRTGGDVLGSKHMLSHFANVRNFSHWSSARDHDFVESILSFHRDS